jgi:methionyl-tRNA formyltransferase
MRIVFIGTVEFSRESLSRCLSAGANVVGVVTRQSSSFNTDFADLVPLASKYRLPIHLATDVNTKDSLDWIRDKTPDVIFCFGWSSLLKAAVLSIPPLGVVGFHPAELPHNRGRHPLVWALALGLKRTASTFFYMDDSADSGDILSQEPVSIVYADDARSLYDKVIATALDQIESFLPLLANGTAPRVRQDHKLSNTWRKREERDGCIDFRMSSRAVYYLVRALTRPYIGAHILQGEQEIRVWRAREVPCELENMEPGRVLEVNREGVLVKCGEGAILLVECEFAQLPRIGDYVG